MDLGRQVEDAHEIRIHVREFFERSLLTAAMLEDACGLFDEAAPLLGRGGQDRIQLPLPHDDVHLAAHARVESSSWTSKSRTGEPLMEYSEPPPRNRVRLIVTSEYSMSSSPSALSIVRSTWARPNAARPDVPAKITSAMFEPRNARAPCSPMTQARASTTFDLPDPLGPTTHVIPGWRASVVALAKDLNPRSVRV